MDQSSCFRQIDYFFICVLSVMPISVLGCHTSGLSLFQSKPVVSYHSDSQDDSETKKNTVLPRNSDPLSSENPSGDESYRPEVIDLSRDCSPQPGDSKALLALIEDLNADQSIARDEKQKILDDIRNVDPQHQEYLIALGRMKLSDSQEKEKDRHEDSHGKGKSLDFVASTPQKTAPLEASLKPAGTLGKYAIEQVGYEDVQPINESDKEEMAEETSGSLVALDLPPDIIRPEEIRNQPTASLGNLDRIVFMPQTSTDSDGSGTTSISRITTVEQNASVGASQFPTHFQDRYDFTSPTPPAQQPQTQVYLQSQPSRNFDPNPIMRQTERQIDRSSENEAVPHVAAGSMMRTNMQSYTNTQHNWEETAEQAAMSLYRKLAQSPDHQESHRDEINLRLLHLALGNRREATRPLTGIAPELQQFWQDELLGLSTLMDQHLIPDPGQRCSVAHQHLVKAQSSLKVACPIRVAALQFINSCEGFGVYEPAPGKFEAGSGTALYAELDNFICKKVGEGEYLTKVSSSYEFLDVNGMIIAEGSYGTHERVTHCEVRDVFIVIQIGIPQGLAPGRYYFNLFVNDLNNPTQKFGQQRIEFTVVGR